VVRSKQIDMQGREHSGETVGLSPKALLAGAIPALGTLLTVLITALISGELDRSELTIAAVGFSGSLVAALGAYLGAPGDVRYRPASAPRTRVRKKKS
jgi:hypothetical protein